MEFTKIKNNLRDLKNSTNIFEILIILIGSISVYMVINGYNFKNISIIIFLVMFVFLVFNLELNFAQKIEKEKDHPVLRINTERFKKNPYEELERYIEDVNYYNNIWRISMAASCIVCLFLLPVIKESYVPIFPYLFLIVFMVVYHVWNWKFHHSYGFVLKSIRHACRHLNKNDKSKFVQICHI
jgi:hypothetical protein